MHEETSPKRQFLKLDIDLYIIIYSDMYSLYTLQKKKTEPEINPL